MLHGYKILRLLQGRLVYLCVYNLESFSITLCVLSWGYTLARTRVVPSLDLIQNIYSENLSCFSLE